MFSKIASIKVEDENTDRMLQSILERINLFANCPFLDGVLLKGISLSVGANSVNHKLGRNCTGYLVFKQDAASSIFLSASDAKTLTLNSSASATVDLWVF
jgi:hypothetical protein